MTTLSNGTVTITPTLVTGYEAPSESRNVAHVIIGRAGDDVSLQPDSLRNGSLELLFVSKADAWAAREMHAAAGVFTLADDDIPEIGMRYVRDGSMTLALESETRELWLLTVGYREVD